MLFSAFPNVAGVLFFCGYAFFWYYLLTKSAFCLFCIFSVFFDTIGKIFYYLNIVLNIDKNGLKAFFAFRLVLAWWVTRFLGVFFKEYNRLL